MNVNRMLTVGTFSLLMALGAASQGGTLSFSGYTWAVRSSGRGGPGPNYWEPNNVLVDINGYLHLRLTQRDGKWYCAELHTQERLGFGRYEFWLTGRVDKLDRNVVLGLFNYPTSDVGRDGTHEIEHRVCPVGPFNRAEWQLHGVARHQRREAGKQDVPVYATGGFEQAQLHLDFHERRVRVPRGTRDRQDSPVGDLGISADDSCGLYLAEGHAGSSQSLVV